MRREEAEKVTNAPLKSEIKRTECRDTRSKVPGLVKEGGNAAVFG